MNGIVGTTAPQSFSQKLSQTLSLVAHELVLGAVTTKASSVHHHATAMEGGALLKFLKPTGKWKKRHFAFETDYSGQGDFVLQQRPDEAGSITQELLLADGFTVAMGASNAAGKPLAPVMGGTSSPNVFTLTVGAEQWQLAARDGEALRSWLADLKSANAEFDEAAAAALGGEQ